MIISTPNPKTATGFVQDRFETDLADVGFVFAHTRTMAVNPEALAAFEDLVRAIVPSIGVRTYELATLAAARAIGSTHCLIAHARRSLKSKALSQVEVHAVLTGSLTSSLTAPDQAVIAFATRLTTDVSGMTDSDTLQLREAGFTDRQIVDISLSAAVRNYYSRALKALAVPVDAVDDLPAHILAAARSATGL